MAKRKEEVDKQIELLLKWRDPIQKTIVQILQEKEIPVPVGYQIITHLAERLEKGHPDLLLLRQLHDARRNGTKANLEMANKMADNVNKALLGDGKADRWICGSVEIPGSKKGKCYRCGADVFYLPRNKKNVKFFHKKICLLCVPHEIDLDDAINNEQTQKHGTKKSVADKRRTKRP